MSVDATKPANTELMSTMGSYERETRAALNSLETSVASLSSVATVTSYACTAGQTTIPMSGLSALRLELVLITGAGAAAITNITGGTEGQIKIFVFLDANVTFTRNPSNIDLNQPAGITSFGGYAGDVICLANVGGNPGTGVNGYWKELFRTPRAY